MLKAITNFLVNLTGECAGDMGMKQHSPSDSLMQQIMSCYSVGDLLPYITYDEQHRLFINKKSYGFVFEVMPIIGFTDKAHNNISTIFKQLLPKGSNLQVLLIGSNKVGPIISRWQNVRNVDDKIIQELTEKRKKFLDKLASQNKIKDYRIIISYSKASRHNPSSYEKNDASNLRQKLKSVFESSNIYVNEIEPVELFSYLDFFLKPTNSLFYQDYAWNKNQDLSSQYASLNHSIQVTKDELVYNEGEFVFRSYTNKSFPEFWMQGGMGKLIGDEFSNLMQIKCPFFFHYGIHIVDDPVLKNKLTAKALDVSAKANSPLSKWIPSLKEEAREWEFVRKQMETGERLIRTQFQVGLLSNKEDISEHEGDLFSIFNSNRWSLEKNKFMQMPSLLNMLPMIWGEGMYLDMTGFRKTRITLSHEPTNLLPFQGEWKGTRNPLMMFIGRRGQLSYWTPFDGENYNVSIVGQSGSGKSVFMQELMMSVLAQGARVFVFDVGRSFEKTVKILGGDYLDFSQKELCINPFSVIDDKDTDETEASLNMILAVLSYMVAPETEGRISNEEANVLRIAVNAVWAKEKQKTNIKKLREFLLLWKGRNEEQRRTSESLALGLADYSGEEHASKIKDKLFNGDANVKFNKSLCVIELESVDTKLKPVVMQMMMNIVSSNVFLGERKKSMIVFDEAWQMLAGDKTAEFIEGLVRKVRKHDGSVVMGTQGIKDFERNTGTQSMLTNSHWVAVFGASKGDLDYLIKRDKTNEEFWDDSSRALFSSVKSEPGEYSEIALLTKKSFAIQRLKIEPFSRILYSTKADEFEEVKRLAVQGLPISKAIEEVARKVFGSDV